MENQAKLFSVMGQLLARHDADLWLDLFDILLQDHKGRTAQDAAEAIRYGRTFMDMKATSGPRLADVA